MNRPQRCGLCYCYNKLISKVVIEKELGATPTIIESEVVDILVRANFVKQHVLFLAPQRTSGSKTPDIQIDQDVKWEIKTITKDGKYTLEHALRHGLKQSKYLIVDIRKLSIALQERYTEKINREYQMTKSWRGGVIVLKERHGSVSTLTLSK